MPSRRCSDCATNWPNTDEYASCPACEGKTWLSSSGTPLDAAEARSQRLHHEFDRFYADREKRQIAALERLLAADDTIIFGD